MFQKLAPLSRQHHRTMRMVPVSGYAFAAREQLVPLLGSELEQALGEYLIAFPADGARGPHAVTGIGDGRNLYVDAQGAWHARYVPMHVRRYPFALLERRPNAPQGDAAPPTLAMMVDEAAPHVRLDAAAGTRLFDEAGEPSGTLQRVQKLLATMHTDSERTQAQVQQLDALQLLKSTPLVVRAGDKALQLQGLRVIDRARFAALPGDALTALRDSGALSLVYAQLFSTVHMRRGVLVRAVAAAAAAAPVAAPGAQAALPDNEVLNLEGIDWSKFSG